MGRKCIVPNCTTGYESNTDKVSLFKIPSDQLEVWKKSIPRKDRELTCKDHVCAKHFNTEDILREIKTDLVTIKLLKPKLSKEAVPTKFPGCPKYLSSDIKKRRIIRKCENWPIIKKRKVQTTIVQDTHEITKISEDIEEPGSSSPSPGIHMQIIAAYNETTMSHAIQVKEEIEESDVTVEPSEEFSFIEKREEMVEMVNCNCTNNVDAPENPKINCPSHIESENITTCLFQPYCPANLSIVSVEAVHEDEKDFPCRWRVQYKFTELLQDPETKYEIPKIHETMRYIIEEWKPRNTLIMAEELITVNEELTWVFVYGLFCSCNRHPVFSDDLKTKQWWTYGLHNC